MKTPNKSINTCKRYQVHHAIISTLLQYAQKLGCEFYKDLDIDLIRSILSDMKECQISAILLGTSKQHLYLAIKKLDCRISSRKCSAIDLALFAISLFKISIGGSLSWIRAGGGGDSVQLRLLQSSGQGE